jgi:AmpD protein
MPRTERAAAVSGEVWTVGWHTAAQRIESPNHGPRPDGVIIDLVVVHAISLPPGQYGGDAIEALFTNRLDTRAHPYFEGLHGLEVSAHFLVRRDGGLVQFVGVDRRAWHAGRSCWRGRDNCNDHSVGIELEGLEGETFEPAQYRCLAGLVRDLAQVWPIREVVGHQHVAPGRKLDPGEGFDWARLQRALRRRRALARVAPEVLRPSA